MLTTKKKMEISDFFDFHSKLLSSAFRAHAIGLKKDEKGIDEHWKLIKGEYLGIDFPVTFKQKCGKKLTDILDTGWPGLYLISDRMKTILEENKLTGWKTYPIKLLSKNGNEIPGYHGFSITGHCGPIDYEKADIFEKRLVPTGPLCRFYRGRYVGLDQWDGTDFFIPNKTYGVIVSQKAANILKRSKITNLHLENLADVEILVPHVKKQEA
jgi:hypothetical protein